EQRGAAHSVFNAHEVDAAVQLVTGLCRDYPALAWRQKIGIITPYKQQLRRLVAAFEQWIGPQATELIEFNTVDGFQGQEKEVVIFSCVRAGEAGVGFLADRRRMNVGLTRARRSLFVLGNAKSLCSSPIWADLVEDVRSRGLLKDATLPLFGRQPTKSPALVASLQRASSSAGVDGEGARADSAQPMAIDEKALDSFNAAVVQAQRQPSRVTSDAPGSAGKKPDDAPAAHVGSVPPEGSKAGRSAHPSSSSSGASDSSRREAPRKRVGGLFRPSAKDYHDVGRRRRRDRGDEPMDLEKHVAFIKSLDKNQDDLEYWMSEHLRVSGVYWGLVALSLMGRGDALDRGEVVSYVLSCQNADGGFGGHAGHDSHLLYTMSAVQILVMCDALDRVDADRVIEYVVRLQNAATGA
ncbi:DEAD-box type RNA helicase, partial [Coemansia nantahalensis]